MTSRVIFFSSFALIAAAGCGTTIVGGGAGGGGGDTGSSSSSSSSGEMVTSSSSGFPTTSSSSGTMTSSSSSSGLPMSSGSLPPPPGGVNPPDGMGSTVFAIKRLLIGDTDPNGTPDAANGWKQYGYDLDGQISTATSTGLCKPMNNAAPKNVYPDGNNGIDNSFGKNVLPILLGLSSDFSTQVNNALASGKHTILLDLEDLGAGGSYYPLLSRMYDGAPLGQPPSWSGNDVWPVTFESLTAPPDLASAKLQAPQSYLVNNTWVAPLQGDMTLVLNGGGLALEVPIHNPVITMQIDASHTHGVNGIIAGVIPTAAFVGSIKKIAGQFDPSLCMGPTIDSITSQIEQASDILLNGSQDPNQTCNGISVGLGFDATAVKFGSVAGPVVPTPNPCGP